MTFDIDERTSDSPLIETIWRTESDRPGRLTSVAVSRWEMVVTRQYGKTRLTVRGPETKMTLVPIPPEAEFVGIFFKHGAFMPDLPTASLVDRAPDLPSATGRSFWLNGSTWQFPTFENADTFVSRLVRKGVLTFDRAVAAAVADEPTGLSPRSVRRRFLRATGLTPGAIRQIDRARRAAALLQRGTSILDTVHETDYFDQPHLTRSLRRFIGHTPAEIRHMNGFDEMSLSYKTREFDEAMDRSPARRKR